METYANLPEWFGSRSKTYVLVCAVVLVAVIGFIDYFTGYEITISIYYLVPVGLASWYIGRAAGAVICVMCAAIGIVGDYAAGVMYSDPVVGYWNTLVTLAFFLVVNYILSSMKRAFEEVIGLARTEPLTGLANARAFFEFAEHELNRARRYKTPFSVTYIDLDNFKAVNDSFGHSTGDALLRSVAISLRTQSRVTDAVARIGGDEFVVLLPETDSEQARSFTERVRCGLMDLMKQSSWPVTVSIGVATFVNPPEDVNEILKEADRAMYDAKNSGKNRAVYTIYQKQVVQRSS